MKCLLLGRSQSGVGVGVGVDIFRPESESLKNCRLRSPGRNLAVRSQAPYEESLIKKFRENPTDLHAYIRKKKLGRLTVGPLILASGELPYDAKQMSVWQMLLPWFIPAPLPLALLSTRSLMGL